MITIRVSKMRLLAVVLMAITTVTALFVGVRFIPSKAAQCGIWDHCPISQRYGVNNEHGVDLLTHGLPIGALKSGTITFDKWECWNDECVQDVTWKLDFPSHAGGSPYMYVQIASSKVHVGEHVVDNQILGYSGAFMEIGLTPDWAYGVSNWRWGINICKVFPWL